MVSTSLLGFVGIPIRNNKPNPGGGQSAQLDLLERELTFAAVKFDVKIPSLDGIARLEIKTIQEGGGWAAYIGFVADRTLNETCLMLGHLGIPYRFPGPSEKEAQETAKKFLQQNYEVVRMIW